MILAALAGAACVFGFAPYYAWPIPMLALVVPFLAWSRAQSGLRAFAVGYAFGLGFFLAGVSWIYVALHVFGEMPAVLAALAVLLFCAFLALFPALAGWATARFAANPGWRLVLAPAAYTLAEMLRGWIFTGFPWLAIGASQVPSSPLAGALPVIGMYGVSLAACFAASLGAIALRRDSKVRTRSAMVVAIAAIFAAGEGLGFVEWTEPAGPAIPIALLQGNVAEELKWRDEERVRTLSEYRDMIVAAKARVVVLPETALPSSFDALPPDYVQGLRDDARRDGKDIVMGVIERERAGNAIVYYNSVVTLDADKPEFYRKRHLVPFGEFIPPGFAWVFAVLRIPMGDLARGADSQGALTVDGTAFGVSICYEDLFGREVIDALPAAQILLNVTNDAWYGRSLAADQHLQASQVRAAETGRWMLRATNTGVTAAIGPRGEVVSRLAQFTKATLVAQAEPRRGMTPYARWGDWIGLAAAAALALFAGWRGRPF
ncbi:MAG TPA: apolipoprotein N-acyltransferase [Usitatibacter sp.]|nr:apolipoprotein N-acyltransferase [Usitatibacter sp.]